MRSGGNNFDHFPESLISIFNQNGGGAGKHPKPSIVVYAMDFPVCRSQQHVTCSLYDMSLLDFT